MRPSATHLLLLLLLPLLAPAASGAAALDGSIALAELRHDSRDAGYRTPAGPVPMGSSVRLRLRAARGDLEQAVLVVLDDRLNVQSQLPMTVAGNDALHDYWEATLQTAAAASIHGYRFLAIDGAAQAWYEDDAARTGGSGDAGAIATGRAWEITAFDPAFQTPAWARDAVVYQVLPDRFRDGDPGNNPAAGSDHYGAASSIVRSGSSDWNAVVCDPRAAGACAGHFDDNFYGGDLAGVIEQLDYIAGLGATVLYLNPIFRSPSYHGYGTSDFLQVDPALGDQSLFQQLVAAAAARGMRVMLEGSFAYSSSDSLYFDLYQRHGAGACHHADSAYRDWYFFTSAEGSGPCWGDTSYASWFGYERLPKLDTADPLVRGFLHADGAGAVAPFWSQWVQGWRLEVGPELDPGITNDPSNTFWEAFRGAVRDVQPESWIVGEEWGKATPWLLGGEWDGATNMQLAAAILGFWRDEPFTDSDHDSGSSVGVLGPLAPSVLAERLLDLEERYPPQALQAMMNLLGNHDTGRALFRLDHNADLANPALYADPTYDWSDALARLRGAVLLQMTLPGAPTIYYGDEVGLVGPPALAGGRWEDDPYNRMPWPWLDESGTPFYTHLQEAGARDGLQAHYRQLTAIRHAHPSLRSGHLRVLLADDTAGVFAFGRAEGSSDAAVVVLNKSAAATTASVDVSGFLPAGLALVDALTGDDHAVAANGRITLALPARGGALLVTEAPFGATPPAAPVLSAASAGSRVLLEWEPVSGAGSYRIYRSPVPGGPRELRGSTTHSDFVDPADAGLQFHYVVVAIGDDSLLQGPPSNEVAVLVSASSGDTVSVTFEATVPAYTTGTVYLVGSVPQLGPWDPGAAPMQQVAPQRWSLTLELAEGTALEYKYTRGSWERVEWALAGGDIANRSLLVVSGGDGNQVEADSVARWADLASNCGLPYVAIPVIQGSGGTTPMAGTELATEGVVVGDFQGSGALRGVFLQDPAGDGDAQTSDGLFVFQPEGVDVAVGQRVRVEGTARENIGGTTEIGTVTRLEPCEGGAAVAPVPVDLPLSAAGDLERYEGMLVAFADTLHVAEVFALGSRGEVLLAEGGRPLAPTQVADPGPEALLVAADQALRQLVLDDGSNALHPDPAPYLFHDGNDLTLRAGDTVAGLTGVLEQRAAAWHLQPTRVVAFSRGNPRPLPPPASGVLRIGAFSAFNYFNGDGAGGGFPTTRGADTLAELERQTDKLVAALLATDLDVIALTEVENDAGSLSAGAALVAALDAASAPGTFAQVDTGVIGADEVRPLILYRPARVAPLGAPAVLDQPPLGTPAVAQAFEADDGLAFELVVVQLKSRSCGSASGPDADQGDGQGCYTFLRTQQAQALLEWLAGDPTGQALEQRLLVGKLQSYLREDPLQVLQGAGLLSLQLLFEGEDAYGTIRDGHSGLIDHVLATPALAQRVLDARLLHINADEPALFDYNTDGKNPAQQALEQGTRFRSAIHDPTVVTLGPPLPDPVFADGFE